MQRIIEDDRLANKGPATGPTESTHETPQRSMNLKKRE